MIFELLEKMRFGTAEQDDPYHSKNILIFNNADQLYKFAQDNNLFLAFTGGLGMSIWKGRIHRCLNDVDFVVRQEDKAAWQQKLSSLGFTFQRNKDCIQKQPAFQKAAKLAHFDGQMTWMEDTKIQAFNSQTSGVRLMVEMYLTKDAANEHFVTKAVGEHVFTMTDFEWNVHIKQTFLLKDTSGTSTFSTLLTRSKDIVDLIRYTVK